MRRLVLSVVVAVACATVAASLVTLFVVPPAPITESVVDLGGGVQRGTAVDVPDEPARRDSLRATGMVMIAVAAAGCAGYAVTNWLLWRRERRARE
jgi:hypothetical protein